MSSIHGFKVGDTIANGDVESEITPAYFENIIRAEFPDYAIRRNVPVTELVGHAESRFRLYGTRPEQVYKAEWGRPYDFVLYRNDKPVAVVMLGDRHSHSSNVKYLISRMYAKRLYLPYINFYTQYPNTRDYVANRLHRFIEGVARHENKDRNADGLSVGLIIGVICLIALVLWIIL